MGSRALPPSSSQPHPRHKPRPSRRVELPSRGWGAGRRVPLLWELPSGLSRHLVGTRSCCGERRGAVSPPVLSAQLCFWARGGKAGERGCEKCRCSCGHHMHPPFSKPLEETLNPLCGPGNRLRKELGRGTRPLRATALQAFHTGSFFYPHAQPLKSRHYANVSTEDTGLVRGHALLQGPGGHAAGLTFSLSLSGCTGRCRHPRTPEVLAGGRREAPPLEPSAAATSPLETPFQQLGFSVIIFCGMKLVSVSSLPPGNRVESTGLEGSGLCLQRREDRDRHLHLPGAWAQPAERQGHLLGVIGRLIEEDPDVLVHQHADGQAEEALLGREDRTGREGGHRKGLDIPAQLLHPSSPCWIPSPLCLGTATRHILTISIG